MRGEFHQILEKGPQNLSCQYLSNFSGILKSAINLQGILQHEEYNRRMVWSGINLEDHEDISYHQEILVVAVVLFFRGARRYKECQEMDLGCCNGIKEWLFFRGSCMNIS